jgi:cell division protein FtsL
MTTRHQGKLPGLNHRLVLEPDRGRARELLVAVALSGLIMLPLLLYVWQSSEWIRNGYQIERLKNQREHLAEVNHQLRLEKASLENLTRIEQAAGTQLGLAEPPAGTVVLVDVAQLKPSPIHTRQTASGRVAAMSNMLSTTNTQNMTGQGSPSTDASTSHPAN